MCGIRADTTAFDAAMAECRAALKRFEARVARGCRMVLPETLEIRYTPREPSLREGIDRAIADLAVEEATDIELILHGDPRVPTPQGVIRHPEGRARAGG